MPKITLDQLKVGQIAIVEKISNSDPILRRRLMDMGITKGVFVKVIKIAPLGDPVAVELRGYELSIRKSELAQIIGEVVNELKTQKGHEK